MHRSRMAAELDWRRNQRAGTSFHISFASNSRHATASRGKRSARSTIAMSDHWGRERQATTGDVRTRWSSGFSGPMRGSAFCRPCWLASCSCLRAVRSELRRRAKSAQCAAQFVLSGHHRRGTDAGPDRRRLRSFVKAPSWRHQRHQRAGDGRVKDRSQNEPGLHYPDRRSCRLGMRARDRRPGQWLVRRFSAHFAVHGDAGYDVDRHRLCPAVDQRHSGLRHAEKLCGRLRPRALARFPTASISRRPLLRSFG